VKKLFDFFFGFQGSLRKAGSQARAAEKLSKAFFPQLAYFLFPASLCFGFPFSAVAVTLRNVAQLLSYSRKLQEMFGKFLFPKRLATEKTKGR